MNIVGGDERNMITQYTEIMMHLIKSEYFLQSDPKAACGFRWRER